MLIHLYCGGLYCLYAMVCKPFTILSCLINVFLFSSFDSFLTHGRYIEQQKLIASVLGHTQQLSVEYILWLFPVNLSLTDLCTLKEQGNFTYYFHVLFTSHTLKNKVTPVSFFIPHMSWCYGFHMWVQNVVSVSIPTTHSPNHATIIVFWLIVLQLKITYAAKFELDRQEYFLSYTQKVHNVDQLKQILGAAPTVLAAMKSRINNGK